MPFNLAEISLAAGTSHYADKTASFAYGAVQTQMGAAEISGAVAFGNRVTDRALRSSMSARQGFRCLPTTVR